MTDRIDIVNWYKLCDRFAAIQKIIIFDCKTSEDLELADCALNTFLRVNGLKIEDFNNEETLV